MNKVTFSAHVLLPSAFLMISVDFVVTTFLKREYFRAQLEVPAILLDSLLAFCLILPILRAGNVGAFGKSLHVFLVGIFSFSAGCAMVRTERFFRFTNDAAYAPLLVYLILGAITFYLLRNGMEATLRLTNLLFWPFCVSIILLLIANFTQMKLENLILEPFSLTGIFRAAVDNFFLSPILLMLLVFLQGSEVEKRQTFGKLFWALVLLAMLLKICEEMVLGEQAAYQTQIFHSLSRLGRISVFKRMDALHVWIWSMVEFAKVALYGCMILKSILQLIPNCRHPEAWTLLCLFLGLFTALLCPENWQQPIQSTTTALFAICTAIRAKQRGKCNA